MRGGSGETLRVTGLLTLVLVVGLAPGSAAWAQEGPSVATSIVRDGTVGPDRSIQPSPQPSLTAPDIDAEYEIGEGLGERRGVALVHSFETFQIGPRDLARFTTDPTLPVPDVIISRVTGGAPSAILGKIRTPFNDLFSGGSRTTDFVLLNPAGVLFGATGSVLSPDGIPPTQIGVGGNFLATTAVELGFADGAHLSVDPSQPLPILTVPDVVRFAFEPTQAAITVDRSGIGAIGGRLQLVASPQAVLRIADSSLSADSDVVLSAGSVAVERSRVTTFGLVGPDSEVGSDGVLLNLPKSSLRISSSGPVSVIDSFLTNFSGGDVVLTSDREIVIGGSRLASNAGDLSFAVRIAGSVVLNAPRIRIGEASTLASRVAGFPVSEGAEQLGGKIDLSGEDISISGGSQLTTDALVGPGTAGDIRVSASESILLDGSTLTSTGFLDAKSGTLQVDAPRVRLANGARITTGTQGSGAAGSVAVTGAEILLESGSSIASSSDGTGPAGTVQVGSHTRTLSLTGGSRIATEAPSGPAPGAPAQGNIVIDVDGSVLLDEGSTISASVGDGQGGDVSIASPDVVVLRDGSQILAQTAQGTGGRISIESQAFIADPSSRVSADAGVGTRGDVEIRSPEVDLQAALSALPAEFLNTSALLVGSCQARLEAGETSALYVAHQTGLPASPEDLLLAFDGLEAPSVLKDVSETAPVGGVDPLADALVAEAEGRRALRRGDLAVSERRLDEAVRRFDGAGRSDASARALLALGQAQQAQGRYVDSLRTLESALARAEQARDGTRVASILGALGDAQVALGLSDAAEAVLTRGADLARHSGAGELASAIENDLGNHFAIRGASEQARELYEGAAGRAEALADPAGAARALANALRAAVEAGDSAAAALAERAERALAAFPGGRSRSYLEIHLGISYARYAASTSDSEARAKRLLRAHALMSAAAERARASADARTLSYALGNLGDLYRSEQRLDEALSLTRAALREAERAAAPDATYRWHWQEGHLLWAQGKTQAALASYRRAIQILEDTRQDSRVRYGARASDFQRTLAPVYLDLVDALFRAADLVQNQADRQRLLVEARARFEQLKASELRNYLRDDCAVQLESRTASLDDLTAGAAVVYPILLPDRVELLVRLPAGLERFTVKIRGQDVEAAARKFRGELQDRASTAYRHEARLLYDWLVRPYAGRLDAERVQTLVFVPDGALRAVPMGALHDGEQFLAARFALATAPGLTLLDPRPLDVTHAKPLLAGVSDGVQEFAPLASVPRELSSIQSIFGGVVLLDGAFSSARLEGEVKSARPTLVHLASHAVFTGDPSTSFVLTHDGRLTMQSLAELLSRTRLREDPVELMVLSACDTAVGDDRAALGLAGVAVSAGARSALGSLWQIADEATYQLIVDFYTELHEPGISRAQALQRAQRTLMADERFGHPYFWSGFLLISNWL